MISHTELQAAGFTGKRQLAWRIKNNMITFAGNRKLKIYGNLSCASGKRMKIAHRIFFTSEQEAIDNNYRPCSHCLHSKYLLWKEIK